MNKTKTDWRSSLGAPSLEALIRIKKEGPPLANFNHQESVKMFFSTPGRADGEKDGKGVTIKIPGGGGRLGVFGNK